MVVGIFRIAELYEESDVVVSDFRLRAGIKNISEETPHFTSCEDGRESLDGFSRAQDTHMLVASAGVYGFIECPRVPPVK